MQVTDIAEPAAGGGYQITPFGEAILGPDGFDPFLEDPRTLWLLHWKITTHSEAPLFAWDFLINRWNGSEFSRSEALREFRREADRLERPISQSTLDLHFDIFLHTYLATRSDKVGSQEDNLDCPLTELELLLQIGERKIDNSGKREAIYAFRSGIKPEITPELFMYCMDEHRRFRYSNEKTLTLRAVAFEPGSPGAVFKLPEWDIRERLELLNQTQSNAYRFRESASIPLVYLDEPAVVSGADLLAAIYAPNVFGREHAH
jgi:hypothetical protein